MRLQALVLASILGVAMISVPPAHAEDAVSAAAPDHNVFVFGGRFQTGYFQDSLSIFADHYEDNFFAGAGYQNFLYHYGDIRAGVEVGAGLRFGESETSGEVWAGVVGRYDGFQVGELRVSPALTFGLSLASGSVGIEEERAASQGRSFPVLYYLGPEVSISNPANPDLEFIARVQHRSGGYGTIGRIDASNALSIGIRYKL